MVGAELRRARGLNRSAGLCRWSEAGSRLDRSTLRIWQKRCSTGCVRSKMNAVGHRSGRGGGAWVRTATTIRARGCPNRAPAYAARAGRSGPGGRHGSRCPGRTSPGCAAVRTTRPGALPARTRHPTGPPERAGACDPRSALRPYGDPHPPGGRRGPGGRRVVRPADPRRARRRVPRADRPDLAGRRSRPVREGAAGPRTGPVRHSGPAPRMKARVLAWGCRGRRDG